MQPQDPQRKLTLEQIRAKHAWDKAKDYQKSHINTAKALPALIMNSGLMQVLAFCHDKGGEYEVISGHLREWLRSRFENLRRAQEFEQFMSELMRCPPREYQQACMEALAWLKWLRLMSAARKGA